MAEIRIIKKYPNRRLYDTQTSTYITITDVKQLVLDQEEFKVIDAKSSDDLTRAILMQIILDEEAGGKPMFSAPVLSNIIRAEDISGEAMAAAVPVVVTRTCPWAIVEERGAGRWVDQRADAIAEAMDAVVGHPELGASMGAHGRHLVEDEYSWPSVAARLDAVYEEVAIDGRSH